MTTANPLRGEVALALGGRMRVLRPSFAALVAVEESLRPVVKLAQDAADGHVALGDLATVVHHCLVCGTGEPRPSVGEIGEMLIADGMVPALKAYRSLLERVLGGAGDAD